MQRKTIIRSISILFIAIITCYSNTLTAEWHFDDIPNIVENKNLHLTSLNPESIAQVVFGHPLNEGQVFRPIAYLSFALNWYFGGDNVVGYHIVNILLHAATSILLYLTILQLLGTPFLQQRSIQSKHLIALLAALLWALNPVQSQAVTYIVQRMATLATFFFLASILCYLIGRRTEPKIQQFFWLLAALASFTLALGSKENSITLLPTLLLIEGIFFHSMVRISRRHLVIGAGLLCLGGSIVYFFTNGSPVDTLTGGYAHRSFTLWERLLTESRIIIFYISLLLYPAPHRLSLDHDIILSTSLLHPPTTLLSIMALLAITLWALRKHKSFPLVAFALLFFLLNHVTESSVFALELIFEHRNYLPSLFLPLPLAVLVVNLYENNRLQTQPALKYGFTAAVLLALCSLSIATYVRNKVWNTEQSLWEDSLAKAPGQSRPYINLAHTYQKMGKHDEAFELSRQSLTKNSPTPAKDRMRAYNNMGNIVLGQGAHTEAIDYYRQALREYENPFSHYYLHKALLANGQIEDARNELTTLMDANPGDGELMTNMAIVLTTQKKYSEAVKLLWSVLDNAGKNIYIRRTAQICLGSVLSRQEDYTGAEKQFLEASSYSEPSLPFLCMIGNNLRKNDRTTAIAQLEELRRHYTSERLLHIIQSASHQNIMFPTDTTILTDFVKSASSANLNINDQIP